MKLVFIWSLAVGVAVRNSEVGDGWMTKVAVGRELAADKIPQRLRYFLFSPTGSWADFGPPLPTRAARIQPTTFLVSPASFLRFFP